MSLSQYVVVSGSGSRILDEVTALNRVREDRSAYLVVVTSVSSLNVISTDRTPMLTQILKVIGDDPTSPAPLTAALSGLVGLSGTERHIVRVSPTRRVVLIETIETSRDEIPWPEYLPRMSDESLLSMALRICRSVNISIAWKAFPSELISELAANTRHHAAQERKILTDRVRAAFGRHSERVSDEDSRRALIDLVEARARLQSQAAVLEAHGATESSESQILENTIQSIDSLLASITSFRLLELTTETARANEIEAQRVRQDAARSKSLNQLVTSLAFPALWVGLLGTNVFPTAQWSALFLSPAGAAVAIVGTALFFGIGWLTGGAIYRAKESSDHTSQL